MLKYRYNHALLKLSLTDSEQHCEYDNDCFIENVSHCISGSLAKCNNYTLAKQLITVLT